MSERVYGWLLRLYPRDFQREFGEEARLLFRDRLQNETGLLPRLRFWLDLIGDCAGSLVHEHGLPGFQVRAHCPQANEVSLLYDLDNQSPRPGPLCIGAMLTLILLFNFPSLIEFGVNSKPVFRGASTSAPGAFSGLRSLWAFCLQGLGAKSRPEFEVASIKPYPDEIQRQVPPPVPSSSLKLGCRGTDGVSDTGLKLAHDIPMGRCVATFIPLQILVAFAYRIPVDAFNAMSGGPEWMLLDRFDLDAKAEQPATEAQLRLMLQSLLAERFKLSVHWEAKQSDVFTLAVAGASKLKSSSVDGECVSKSPSVPCGAVSISPDGSLHGERATIAALMKPLGIFTRNATAIVDTTGLTGLYDISTTGWNLKNDPASPLPDLTTMLKEQLGLNLKREKKPVDILVIDHVEKPALKEAAIPAAGFAATPMR